MDYEFSAKLACGCTIATRAGVTGSPVTIVVARKADGCGVSIHVAGLPIYDHREALRPATRTLPPAQTDFEES